MDIREIAEHLDLTYERSAYLVKALRSNGFIEPGKRGIKDDFSDEVVDLINHVHRYSEDGYTVPQSLRLIEGKSDPESIERQVQLLKRENEVLRDKVAVRPPSNLHLFHRFNQWFRNVWSFLKFKKRAGD